MKFDTIGLFIGLATALPQGKSSGGITLDVPKVLPGSNMLSTIASLSNAWGLLDAGIGPITRNELTEGSSCGKVIFIFARASSEVGNMGGSMGPMLCNGLKKAYGDTGALCQGVGGAYGAGILDNVSFKGTTGGAIKEATTMFTTASTKCPGSVITFGGYSQGTAVMHNTVSALPAALKEKLVAGVLFGDTLNTQDKSQIPNFPKGKVEVYCTKDDGVCSGVLVVTNGHFAYTTNGDGDKAFAFLRSKIDAAIKEKPKSN